MVTSFTIKGFIGFQSIIYLFNLHSSNVNKDTLVNTFKFKKCIIDEARILFDRSQGGMHLCTEYVAHRIQYNTIPTKPLISKQQSPTQGKQEAIN